MSDTSSSKDLGEIIQRSVVVNQHGYQEVDPAYRTFRSASISTAEVSGRIRCPMIDAARSDRTYGHLALEGTSRKELLRLARTIGFEDDKTILAVAYLSGSLFSIPGNIINRHFDDSAINTGLITWFKHNVNTGILSRETFDQQSFNALVLAIHPQLKGQAINSSWLYSEAAAELYIHESDCETVLNNSKLNSKSNFIGKLIGSFMSKFEMTELLFGILSQLISNSSNRLGKPAEKAILLRDVYDFYKLGWFPAHIEERLERGGLLRIPGGILQAK